MIHGVDVDLAFRLDWKEAQPRVPIYGYNDHEYTKTISGRKLIQGFLVMNYIAPHYLTSYFSVQDRIARQKSEQDTKFDLFEILPPTLTKADRIARAEMIASLMFKEAHSVRGPYGDSALSQIYAGQARHFDSVAHGAAYKPGYSKSKLGTTVNKTQEVPIGIKQKLFDAFGGGRVPFQREPHINTVFDISRPFNMEVYHLEPEFAPWYIVLDSVEITDVSQTMSAAGAEGSSDPLYETYEFIAKRRTIIKTRHPSLR